MILLSRVLSTRSVGLKAGNERSPSYTNILMSETNPAHLTRFDGKPSLCGVLNLRPKVRALLNLFVFIGILQTCSINN